MCNNLIDLNQMFLIQDIVTAVHTETQLLDAATGRSIHEGYGMFVLVLTSHGNEGSIIGCDYTHVKLTDIYDLLSAKNFPAMRGKPKLIIIQACSGGKPLIKVVEQNVWMYTGMLRFRIYSSLFSILSHHVLIGLRHVL